MFGRNRLRRAEGPRPIRHCVEALTIVELGVIAEPWSFELIAAWEASPRRQGGEKKHPADGGWPGVRRAEDQEVAASGGAPGVPRALPHPPKKGPGCSQAAPRACLGEERSRDRPGGRKAAQPGHALLGLGDLRSSPGRFARPCPKRPPSSRVSGSSSGPSSLLSPHLVRLTHQPDPGSSSRGSGLQNMELRGHAARDTGAVFTALAGRRWT